MTNVEMGSTERLLRIGELESELRNLRAALQDIADNVEDYRFSRAVIKKFALGALAGKPVEQ